jgi:acyl-CoA hydrolase
VTGPRSTTIAYADGADGASTAPLAVAALLGITGNDVRVVVGWTPEARSWLYDPAVRGHALMAGYSLGPPIADGRLTYLPVRLSSVPGLVRDALRPDVAVVAGVRRGDELAFAGTVGCGPAMARAAERVVVELDDESIDLGAPAIPGNIVATVERPERRPPLPDSREPDDVDRAIAAHVRSVLPERATLQLGPGAIADAIVAGLDRPVSIWSGLVTERVAALAGRGLLDGPVVAGYTWGGPAIAALAASGALRLEPVEVSHDLATVSAIDGFVGCNTALQVGLDGSVNIERVGGRLVAGIGGHADYCAAATQSRGGVSLIALRATTRRGVSTIVPRVEVVSTPRCDVEVVVTEHGVADLRGVDDAGRSRRLAAIAAPEHRAALAGADRDERS